MADPNSTSSKACKARRYGVRLISEDEFLKMMDLDKTKVEAETEYKKTHKEKKVLDWKTCLDVICKKLNLSHSKTTEPIYRRGKDEKLVRISLYSDKYEVSLGDAYLRRRLFSWEKDHTEKEKAVAASYPEFGMPGSTEELKLKLEILGWSIL